MSQQYRRRLLNKFGSKTSGGAIDLPQWSPLESYSLSPNEFINIGIINPSGVTLFDDGSGYSLGMINVYFDTNSDPANLIGKTIYTIYHASGNGQLIVSVNSNADKPTINGTEYSNNTSAGNPNRLCFILDHNETANTLNNAMWFNYINGITKYKWTPGNQPYDFTTDTVIVGSTSGNSCTNPITDINVNGSMFMSNLYPYFNNWDGRVYFCTPYCANIFPVINRLEWCETMTDNSVTFVTDFDTPSINSFQVLTNCYTPASTENMICNSKFLLLNEVSNSLISTAGDYSNASTQKSEQLSSNNDSNQNILFNTHYPSTSGVCSYCIKYSNLSEATNNFSLSDYLNTQNNRNWENSFTSFSTLNYIHDQIDNIPFTVFPSSSAYSGVRFYWLLLYTNETLIPSISNYTNLEFTLIPARKANKYGLYDIISDTLYENSGTGTLRWSDGKISYPSSYNENIQREVLLNGTIVTTITITDQYGNPVEKTINSYDSSGNSSTQYIEYRDGEEIITGYTIETINNTNGGLNLSGNEGIDTGIIVFDGHDFEISLTAKFLKADITGTANPVLIFRDYDTGGFSIIVHNYSASWINESNPTTPTTSQELDFGCVKYIGGSATDGSLWFRYKEKYNNSYWVYSPGTDECIYTFKIQCINDVISTYMYNESGVLVSMPGSQTTCPLTHDFTGLSLQNIDIILGYFNNNGTDRYTKFEILDFYAKKII